MRAMAASFKGAIATDRLRIALLPHERAVILDSLTSGALLENENFPIAEKILDRFVEEKGIEPDDWLVLNGLPRHAGQARDLEQSVEIKVVVYLTGTAAVIKERIRLDAGGDRAGRSDDSLEAVEKKLKIFEERIWPLHRFYADRRVPILKIPVGAGTTAEEVLAELERRL